MWKLPHVLLKLLSVSMSLTWRTKVFYRPTYLAQTFNTSIQNFRFRDIIHYYASNKLQDGRPVFDSRQKQVQFCMPPFPVLSLSSTLLPFMTKNYRFALITLTGLGCLNAVLYPVYRLSWFSSSPPGKYETNPWSLFPSHHLKPPQPTLKGYITYAVVKTSLNNTGMAFNLVKSRYSVAEEPLPPMRLHSHVSSFIRHQRYRR